MTVSCKTCKEEFPKQDSAKTAAASARGWTVLRFWEHDILGNLTTVVEKITATRVALLSQL